MTENIYIAIRDEIIKKQREIIKELWEFIDKECRQSHYYCEDSFYSCPKCTVDVHPDDMDDKNNNKCDCGADKFNNMIDTISSKYKEYLTLLKEKKDD